MTSQVSRLSLVNYEVHTGRIEVKLESVDAFCYNERINFISGFEVTDPLGNHYSVEEGPEVIRERFGVWIEAGRNTTSTLSVSADDASLYGHSFEITVTSKLKEEESWFSFNQVKINFLKPQCRVSLEEI